MHPAKKEDVILDEINSTSKDGITFVNPSQAKSGTNLVNGMLEFPDVTTFLATMDNLELQAELYDDDFMKQWGYLNEDDIDDKEDELNYDPETPFTEFENQFSGFRSLRRKIEG